MLLEKKIILLHYCISKYKNLKCSNNVLSYTLAVDSYIVLLKILVIGLQKFKNLAKLINLIYDFGCVFITDLVFYFYYKNNLQL